MGRKYRSSSFRFYALTGLPCITATKTLSALNQINIKNEHAIRIDSLFWRKYCQQPSKPLKMKTLLLFASLLMAGSAIGQKTKTEKAKFDYTRYPSIPVEGLKELGFQVFTADLPFNKDTLRLYLGNMDFMKSNAEQLSKVKFKAMNEINVVGGEGDVTIDMAIGEPMVVSKELKTGQCMVPKDGCTQYYFTVQYRMPALVQARNAEGVIDTWELNPDMNLQFGNEQIEKHSKTDGGSVTSIQVVNFNDEIDLNLAFADYGEASLARKGILTQIGNLAESVYDRVFFEETTLSYEIAYGSGKATDYAETETAASTAAEALESRNFAALDGPIKTWEKWLEQYDASDKKAAVNAKVAQGLFENLSIAYTFTGEYDKARAKLDKTLELAQEGFVNENEVARLNDFYGFIDHMEMVDKYNSALNPEEFVTAPDIKKRLGNRKSNEDIDFLIAEDKYAEIAKLHGKSAPEKDISEMTVEEFLSQSANAGEDDVEEISLEGRVENNMLILSGLVDGNMRGKALPASICDYPEIKTIRAVNIGLTSLPDCMSELTALKTLTVSKNSFTSLPDAFAGMNDLQNLDISDNQLTSLPESIYGLKNLKKLSVSGNQIADDQLKRLEEALPDVKIK